MQTQLLKSKTRNDVLAKEFGERGFSILCVPVIAVGECMTRVGLMHGLEHEGMSAGCIVA